MNSILSQIEEEFLTTFLQNNPKQVFLIGAGVSMESPSLLPSALQFTRSLLKFVIPSSEIEKLMSLPNLRYEMIVDRVKGNIDPELHFLDYLETHTKFNLIHYFLAKCIINQKFVITTNFDYQIESALLSLLDNQPKSKIIPVVTKEDFVQYNHIAKLGDQYPLIKIHGSKRNIIKNLDTSDSLITTLSSLGKNREEGETFSIESYKKPLMNSILTDAIVLVMGYSGNDDFDITPLLKEFHQLKGLIWIEHQLNGQIKLMNCGSNLDSVEISQDESKLDKFLRELSSKHHYNILKITGNTKKVVEEILWHRCFAVQSSPFMKLPNSSNSAPISSTAHEFEQFIEPYYKNIPESFKYAIAARIYSDLSYDTDVIRICELGIPITEKEQSLAQKSILLHHLGLSYSSRGDLQHALQYVEESLSLAEKSGYTHGIPGRLISIGYFYKIQHKFDKALEFYNRALKILEESGDQDSLTVVLNNIGLIYHQTGQSEVAIDYINRSLKIAAKTGDLEKKATRLSNIATIYIENQQNLDEAYKFSQEALNIYDQIGDTNSKIGVFNNLGLIMEKKGNFFLARENYLKSIELAEKLHHMLSVASSYTNLSDLYDNQEDLPSAIDYMKKGLDIYEKFGDFENQVNCIRCLGKFYTKSNELALSLEVYNRSLGIAEKNNSAFMKNEILFEIAEFYYIQENYIEAAKYYELAITPAQILNRSQDIAVYFKNIGSCKQILGLLPEALNYFYKSLKLFEELKQQKDIMQNYLAIGRVYNDLERKEDALSNFQKALSIATSLNDSEGKIESLDEIGDIQMFLSHFSDAIDTQQQIIRLAESSGDDSSVGQAYGNLGVIHTALNDFSQAIFYCEKALDIAIRIGNTKSEEIQKENLEYLRHTLS